MDIEEIQEDLEAALKELNELLEGNSKEMELMQKIIKGFEDTKKYIQIQDEHCAQIVPAYIADLAHNFICWKEADDFISCESTSQQFIRWLTTTDECVKSYEHFKLLVAWIENEGFSLPEPNRADFKTYMEKRKLL